MRRIAMMVLRLFLKAPYFLFRIWWCGKSDKISYEEGYQVVRHVTKAANRAGRVTIESYGLENIPEENGFIFFPNHQGLFDVLVFLESCPKPFAFVIKKEASQVILLKQVIAALGSLVIDREVWATHEIEKEVGIGGGKLAFGVTSQNQPLVGIMDIAVSLTDVTKGVTLSADGINRLPADNAIILYNSRLNSTYIASYHYAYKS